MPIRHAYQTATSDDPGSEVSASEWNADHSITDSIDFPVISTTPTGATDVLKVFAGRRGGRSLLRTNGQNGVDTSLQPAFFGNSVRMWWPSTGTTPGVFGQATLTAINNGTGAAVSHVAVGTGSDIAALFRFILGTGTVAGNTSGVRDASAMYFRGNSAGRGGWFQHFRFGVEVTASDIQVQLGMAAQTTALAGEPSAFVNCAMIGKDSTDTNWQFMVNDGSGTATKVNTTVAVTQGQVLDYFCFAPPNGSSISFELRDAIAGTALASHTATTDLPVNTTLLTARASIRAPTSTTARQLAIGRHYTETDL